MPLDSLNIVQQTAPQGGYIEWILTGGGSVFVGLLYMYHTRFIDPKIKEILGKVSAVMGKTNTYDSQIDKLKGKLKRDIEGFAEFQKDYIEFKGHTEEAILRVDKAESRIEDFIVEIKASNSSIIARFGDMKTGVSVQEGRIASLEKSERKHYEELKEMSSDSRIMEKEIQYLRTDMADIKDSLKQMSSAILEMKDLIVSTTMKPK